MECVELKNALTAQLYNNTNLSANVKNQTELFSHIERGTHTSSKIEGDKFFQFNQNVPSDQWQVVHNLKKYPSVFVVDSAETVVIGEITYISENELIITFNAPFSGKAYLN